MHRYNELEVLYLSYVFDKNHYYITRNLDFICFKISVWSKNIAEWIYEIPGD